MKNPIKAHPIFEGNLFWEEDMRVTRSSSVEGKCDLFFTVAIRCRCLIIFKQNKLTGFRVFWREK